MTAPVKRPLSSDARAIVALFDRGGRPPKARSAGGALILLAAQLDSPASETAEAVGITVVEAVEIVRGKRAVGARLLMRLDAWVRLCLARVAHAAGPDALPEHVRADVVASAWASAHHLAPWSGAKSRAG